MGNGVGTIDSFSFVPELNYLFPVTVNYWNDNALDVWQCQSQKLLPESLVLLSMKVRRKT
jgi:hypothetical protein